jgi:hypothetical protein
MRIAWRSVGTIVRRVEADVDAVTDRLAGLRRIGIDEISYKKGHKYLTVVVDSRQRPADLGRGGTRHQGRLRVQGSRCPHRPGHALPRRLPAALARKARIYDPRIEPGNRICQWRGLPLRRAPNTDRRSTCS